MLLSRCNFHAITRFNASRLYRLGFVSCPIKQTTIESFGKSKYYKPQSCCGKDYARSNVNIYMSRCYNSAPPPSQPVTNDDSESQNIFQRFKTIGKKYWYIVLPVHLVTSTVWFGSFYFIASSGIDVPALLDSLRFPDWIIDKVRDGNSWTSYLVIAYGLYKIFTPLRYMVTLGGTSLTIRYMQKLGYEIKNTCGPKKP